MQNRELYITSFVYMKGLHLGLYHRFHGPIPACISPVRAISLLFRLNTYISSIAAYLPDNPLSL